MELKQATVEANKIAGVVLIVPSGIETKVIDATDWNLVAVLIVPSGIETFFQAYI